MPTTALPQASVPAAMQDRPGTLAWRQGYSDSTKLPSKTSPGVGHPLRTWRQELRAQVGPRKPQPRAACLRPLHPQTPHPPTLRTPSSLCPTSLSVPVFQQLLFEPLCHILGILTIFQVFLLLHLLRSLVTTDQDSLKVQMTVVFSNQYFFH